MLKKLSEQRKMHSSPCCRTGRHLICNPGCGTRKAAVLAAKKVQRNHGLSSVVGWIPTIP